ncbi:uncharacterized protein LOC135462932 isoform X2 [Liolophura sinensis]|uniref:uncharacterized protein LOC135462932 isoform X2 n=1 Tax=Liolophura sinensis TaxID=3198878 RepID=UPI003158A3B8
MAIAQCPKLSNLTENPTLLTIDNISEPRLSDYRRTVGITVKLTCALDSLKLTPNNPTLTCQSNKQWNAAIPVCERVSAATTPPRSSPVPTLSQEQVTIVGITGGVGGFILIILVALIVCICIMQNRSRTRRADKTVVRPAGTDVTSLTTVHPLDTRAVRGYSAYPSFTSHDYYPEHTRQTYHSMALPTATSGYDVYNNPSFRLDPDERDLTSRDDVLDVIARERMDQLAYEKDRFRSLEYPRPDYFVGEDTRAHGKRFAKRGPRSPEAVTRAQRTLQYVEEHSSGSPEPSYLGQGRYDDKSTIYPDGSRSLDRYLDDSRSRGRYPGNYSPHRYFSNPLELAQGYPGYPDNRGSSNIHRGYDRYDLSGTKTHYTNNRHR